LLINIIKHHDLSKIGNRILLFKYEVFYNNSILILFKYFKARWSFNKLMLLFLLILTYSFNLWYSQTSLSKFHRTFKDRIVVVINNLKFPPLTASASRFKIHLAQVPLFFRCVGRFKEAACALHPMTTARFPDVWQKKNEDCCLPICYLVITRRNYESRMTPPPFPASSSGRFVGEVGKIEICR